MDYLQDSKLDSLKGTPIQEYLLAAIEAADAEPEGADEGTLHIQLTTNRVLLEKNDRSLSEFHRWYRAGRLIIDPEWQRSYIWDNKRASRLIESLLLEIPIPVIYLARTIDGKYEVIDGVQRLRSIFRFFEGEITLKDLEILKDLNKKNFADLTESQQNVLQDATLRTFELSPQTPSNLLFDIFERLNTGGIPLNEMEVRNCVFRGKLNDLIKTLAGYSEFTESVNQKDLSRRMNDRSLILRFLAFYEKGYTKTGSGLKNFLNEFLEIYQNPPETKLREFERQFKKAMRASQTVFGNHAFRLRRLDSKGGGEWATRVNASIFQVISVSFTNYELGQITERADAIYEEYLDLTITDQSWIDAVTKNTANAASIKYTFESWNHRLEEVMSGTQGKDSKRIFSRMLKEEMWKQEPKCAICGQEIKSVRDAAMDHDRHYWRCGKTVPSNAQLVHRLCNLKRED